MIDLVIFDLDGVLLDSESLYRTMNFRLFEELGAPITEKEYDTFIGIHAELMWGYIKEKGNLSQSVQELINLEKEAKYETLSSQTLTPNPGLMDLLEFIKSQNIPMCIASSGLMKNIKVILPSLGVDSYFTHIVSGEMVENGKPAPDIFLQAAAHFDVDPTMALVIEDSRNGTIAAKAAYMTCVGYRNEGSGPQDLSKADFVIDSLTAAELWDTIRR